MQYAQFMLIYLPVHDKAAASSGTLPSCTSVSGHADNLKLIRRRRRIFFTTLKSDRQVSLSPEQGYIYLDNIVWIPERLAHAVIVKLKEVPFKVRLFKLVAPNGDLDWIITHDLAETLTAGHEACRFRVAR